MRAGLRIGLVLLAAGLAGCGGLGGGGSSAPRGVDGVDDARLEAAAAEPASWLTYGGDYA